MPDFIRLIESDLFGGYEWAAEMYAELAGLDGAPERLAVHRGLLRAYEALGKPEDAMRAAEGLVRAEEDLDDVERDVLAPLDAPREALFEAPTIEGAERFLAVFDAEWKKGEHAAKQALVPDAILAALANSNVVASLGRKALSPDAVKARHARAAELYEEIHAMLAFRVGTGAHEWRETSQSALFRASAAWRLAGEEARAKRAASIAGEPPGASELRDRGLRRGAP